jgi:hypothetical protein
MELARAWLDDADLPGEVRAAIERHGDFGPVRAWSAEPEARLRFDKFAGEPRNTDLLIDAKDMHGRYLIAVEGKADEPFGETVGDALAAALERRIANHRSNGLARIDQLALSLFGPRAASEPRVEAIRYQLLTACAGAICEAERWGVPRALMLVHEFITDKTSRDLHERNARDFNLFLTRLSHSRCLGIERDQILGPYELPGEGCLFKATAKLYVGKVVRNIGERGITARDA